MVYSAEVSNSRGVNLAFGLELEYVALGPFPKRASNVNY